MSFDEEPEGDPHGECAKEISDLMLERDRYKKALEGITEGFTIEWCESHAANDYCVTMDHKDEMALAEAILIGHHALQSH